MSLQLVLCRHTETPYNVEDLYTSQEDICLNAHGRSQADRLARRIGGLSDVIAIFSSDLQRAAYLAERIGEATHVTPVLDKALREVALGKMTGLAKAEALAQYPEEQYRTTNPRFDFRPLGGESAAQVVTRQMTFLQQAIRRLNHYSEGRIVVVGHGTALRLLFRDQLGSITNLHEQGDYQEIASPW